MNHFKVKRILTEIPSFVSTELEQTHMHSVRWRQKGDLKYLTKFNKIYKLNCLKTGMAFVLQMNYDERKKTESYLMVGHEQNN